MNMFGRLLVVITAALLLLGTVMLFTYDIIKIEWISFMEIQPSFKPMEHPLPLAAQSIPIEGPAYIPGQGAPVNPIPAEEVSIERGRVFFTQNCVQCHGPAADGNGIIAIVNKPANLMSDVTQNKSDGTLFMTISNGVLGTGNQIRMPALNENLTVRDRWDVVNYLRWLKANPPQ